jgi:hypothetical protein
MAPVTDLHWMLKRVGPNKDGGHFCARLVANVVQARGPVFEQTTAEQECEDGWRSRAQQGTPRMDEKWRQE